MEQSHHAYTDQSGRASGVPGLDLPGLDIAYLARGFGCTAVDVKNAEDLEREFVATLRADMPTVIVVPSAPGKAML
ncbi:thiamine pyrophosphate-dependent enzyme [Streptomyces sp. NPDC051664]|uniref:thiamine pyrophosphate-dependent enzyme n=1 Tax=Streptomyces sp. NPDC051664 TaxID=3365668 RepID=UPI00379794AA